MSTRASLESYRDPALDPEHQHHHEHIHHARTHSDNAVYTVGTTVDSPHIPSESPLSTAGGKLDDIVVPDEEKSSGISDSTDQDDVRRKRGFGAIYRRYKPLFHAFVFCVFTG